MTFIKRLMEIKEDQLALETWDHSNIIYICDRLDDILKVLKGGKDGKRKISRKN